MDTDDELLAVRVAELYYDENKTQDEIGGLLGITRWKVGRLLAQAATRGIVRIEIVHPRARRLGARARAARALRPGRRGRRAHPDAEDAVDARVAQAAADYLTALRPVPRTLGVSWGRTLDDVAQRLPDGWATGVNVVQINGGVSLNRRPGTAATMAATIAQQAAARPCCCRAPRSSSGSRPSARSNPTAPSPTCSTLAARPPRYLFSAGVADASSVLVDSGYLTAG